MKLRTVVFLLGTGVIASCAHTSAMSAERRDTLPVRPASDAPARFEPRSASLRIAPVDTLAGPGCLSPMVDPRDGTEVRFVFSTSYGEYEPPAGRYGARPGELLRLECNTGRVLGLVPR